MNEKIKVCCGGVEIAYERTKAPNEYRFTLSKNGRFETLSGDLSEVLLKLFHFTDDGEYSSTVAAVKASAMQNNDVYMAFVAKECTSRITQEEADFLYAADGNPRFIPREKVYEAGDIDVLAAKRGVHPRRVCFDCTVSIDGKTYGAKWYPCSSRYETREWSENETAHLLVVYSHKFKRTINIATDIVEKIKKCIAQSESKV